MGGTCREVKKSGAARATKSSRLSPFSVAMTGGNGMRLSGGGMHAVTAARCILLPTIISTGGIRSRSSCTAHGTAAYGRSTAGQAGGGKYDTCQPVSPLRRSRARPVQLSGTCGRTLVCAACFSISNALAEKMNLTAYSFAADSLCCANTTAPWPPIFRPKYGASLHQHRFGHVGCHGCAPHTHPQRSE